VVLTLFLRNSSNSAGLVRRFAGDRLADEGLAAPAVVLDIFGALSLAWVDLVVLDDPPS